MGIPTATVTLPSLLRERIGQQTELHVEGATVREIITHLESRFPGIRFYLCHETGELRPYVNIFLERTNIRYLQGLDTPVAAGVSIRILPSVAGG